MRVGVFVDISNLYFTIKKKFGKKLDYKKFLTVAKGDDELVCAMAYGAHEEGQADSFIAFLSSTGFITKFKAPRIIANNIKKADWDVGIVIDVIRFLNKLDIVVLGSGDGDFEPLVKYCQGKGARVHVWGVFIAKELRQCADMYHEIGEPLLHAAPERENELPNESSDDSVESPQQSVES